MTFSWLLEEMDEPFEIFEYGDKGASDVRVVLFNLKEVAIDDDLAGGREEPDQMDSSGHRNRGSYQYKIVLASFHLHSELLRKFSCRDLRALLERDGGIDDDHAGDGGGTGIQNVEANCDDHAGDDGATSIQNEKGNGDDQAGNDGATGIQNEEGNGDDHAGDDGVTRIQNEEGNGDDHAGDDGATGIKNEEGMDFNTAGSGGGIETRNEEARGDDDELADSSFWAEMAEFQNQEMLDDDPASDSGDQIDQNDVSPKKRALKLVGDRSAGGTDQIPGHQSAGSQNEVFKVSCYPWRCGSSGLKKKTSRIIALEAQVDVKYYEKCFSRMYGTPNLEFTVDEAFQLWLVSSQIDFQIFAEESVRILSYLPWTTVEGDMIRDLHTSLYIPSDQGASDLKKRLDKEGVSKVETDIGLRTFTERFRYFLDGELKGQTAARNMTNILPRDFGEIDSVLKHEVREKAIDEKHAQTYNIMSSSSFIWGTIASQERGADIRDIVPLASGTVKHLETIKERCKSLKQCLPVTLRKLNVELHKIKWLISLFLRTKATEDVDKLFLTESNLADRLHTTYQELEWPEKYKCEWAQLMIESIIEAIVHHSWVLNSSERFEFLLKWGWLTEVVAPDCSEFIAELRLRRTHSAQALRTLEIWWSMVRMTSRFRPNTIDGKQPSAITTFKDILRFRELVQVT